MCKYCFHSPAGHQAKTREGEKPPAPGQETSINSLACCLLRLRATCYFKDISTQPTLGGRGRVSTTCRHLSPAPSRAESQQGRGHIQTLGHKRVTECLVPSWLGLCKSWVPPGSCDL